MRIQITAPQAAACLHSLNLDWTGVKRQIWRRVRGTSVKRDINEQYATEPGIGMTRVNAGVRSDTEITCGCVALPAALQLP